MNNGYAYEINGSVYFDSSKFHQKQIHDKLQAHPPLDTTASSKSESASTTASSKGDSVSTTADNTSGKNNKDDIILWIKSRENEPSWQGNWSIGMPGPNIGCGVEAGNTLNPQFDIHTGNIDSIFLHPDNELAQSETNIPWFYYFNHNYHLNIPGCKISESLKNNFTNQQPFKKQLSRQLRLLCLLQSWLSTFDYNDDEIEKALRYENTLNYFFRNIEKHLVSFQPLNKSNINTKYNEQDSTLNEHFSTTKKNIHLALCDSINTSSVMENINQLITTTNNYINENIEKTINHVLLNDIAVYVTGLLDIFGLYSPDSSYHSMVSARLTEQQSLTSDEPAVVTTYLEYFTFCRDAVRKQTNDILQKLGVQDEDEDDTSPPIFKFWNPYVLISELENKWLLHEEAKASKEEKNPNSKDSSQATPMDTAAAFAHVTIAYMSDRDS